MLLYILYRNLERQPFIRLNNFHSDVYERCQPFLLLSVPNRYGQIAVQVGARIDCQMHAQEMESRNHAYGRNMKGTYDNELKRDGTARTATTYRS